MEKLMGTITKNEYTNEHGHPILEILDNEKIIMRINLYEAYCHMKFKALNEIGAKILLPTGEMVAC